MIKNLRGHCAHCGGMFEFPADAVGTIAGCPHCGQPTELTLPAPATEPRVSRRSLFYVVAAVLILALGCVAILLLLRRAERLSERKASPPRAPAHSAR
jgi:rRNA maturation protein Nop10